jgi:hypothetical protein
MDISEINKEKIKQILRHQSGQASLLYPGQ